MSNQVTVVQKASAILNGMIDKYIESLPSDVSRARIYQSAVAVMNSDIDFSKCKPQDVAMEFFKGVVLGLEASNKEYYVIPYGTKPTFQMDYKGAKKLAMKYSEREIKDVKSYLVKEGDHIDFGVKDGEDYFEFKPVPFSKADVVGVVSVVYFTDGGMVYETMSTEEVEEIRNGFSKAKNSPAWVKTWGEMAKKTVMRRALKGVTLNFENPEQTKAFIEDDMDFQRKEVQAEVTDTRASDDAVLESIREVGGELFNAVVVEKGYTASNLTVVELKEVVQECKRRKVDNPILEAEIVEG